MKGLLYWFGYTVVLSVIAWFILSGTDTTGVRYKVSGVDAMKIAASRPLYWVFIIAMAVVNYFAVKKVISMIKEEEHAFAIHGLAFIVSLLLIATVFIAPANIKADPIGSGATTEQIEYLRSKGMDK